MASNIPSMHFIAIAPLPIMIILMWLQLAALWRVMCELDSL
jgi:hypothetical protein